MTLDEIRIEAESGSLIKSDHIRSLVDSISANSINNFMRAGTSAEMIAWTPVFGYGIFMCETDGGTYNFISGSWG